MIIKKELIGIKNGIIYGVFLFTRYIDFINLKDTKRIYA